MSRIRAVKPEFWADEKIARLTFLSRLLFIGIWNFCDDEGYCRATPKFLKANIFPYDDLTDKKTHGALSELVQLGFIDVFRQGGETYLKVKNWKKHQSIQRPSKWRVISNISEGSVNTHVVPHDDSTIGEGKGKGKGEGAAGESDDSILRLVEIWNKNTNGKLPKVAEITEARKKKIRRRLQEKPDLNFWLDVVQKIEASDFCKGENKRGWRASLDWLVHNPDTPIKVAEGNYTQQTQTNTPQPTVELPFD